MIKEEQNNRRSFLKTGLMASAAVVAAGIVSCDNEKDAKHSLSDKKTPLMDADGNIIYMDETHIHVHKDFMGITDEESRVGIPGKKFVTMIDLAKCDGCGKCTKACNKMHFLPKEKEWIKVEEFQDAPKEAPYYFVKPCYHCDNPPCTKVCPVDATFKREDGIVAIDNDRCIGCRFCMAACPYSVRIFNWDEPTKPTFVEVNAPAERVFQSKRGCMEKCDFCPHMSREDKLPACVTGGPMDAIYFGDENEDAVTNKSGKTVGLSQLLEDRAAYRYMEELGTKPRVYYLPPYNREYPKPGSPCAPEMQDMPGMHDEHSKS
jgi:molybdopterin-containing oxidoreductase family iron-sulfur binding subunit